MRRSRAVVSASPTINSGIGAADSAKLTNKNTDEGLNLCSVQEYLQLDENGRFRYEFGWYQGLEMGESPLTVPLRNTTLTTRLFCRALATEAYTGTWAYDWSQPKFGKIMCQATQAKYAIPGKLEKIASERLLQFHVQQGEDVILVSRFHNKVRWTARVSATRRLICIVI
jgi:hypothetical protein